MVQKLLFIVGVALLAMGIIGFFNDPLLGVFEVDTEHNIVHIVTGGLGIYFSRNLKNAQLYGKIMTAVYGLVTVLGFFSTHHIFGMEINYADNLLHVALTLLFLYIGFAPKGPVTRIKA